MNWYNFESRFPSTFKAFTEWFRNEHLQEFERCIHPIYVPERLVEFFRKNNIAMQPDPLNSVANNYKAYNTDHTMRGRPSEHYTLQSNIYAAFEALERKSYSSFKGLNQRRGLVPDSE